ncbi:MAG: hormogonium polysaccharide biosynthesis protein HpsA [Hormoscilla sp.]
MSIGKFFRKLQRSFRHLWRMSVKLLHRLRNRLLASLVGRGRRGRRHGTSGFVLPTVAMVMLVVVLLTTAMVLRSLDRAKNASNFRVSQAALNASGPAIERAKAKIEALFSDPTLPRSTPSERTLYNAIVSQPGRYTFGDEIALKVIDDFGNGAGVYSETGDGTVNSTDDGSATELANSETSNTAWKFPVDTDNNGKYDSFTLYGLYFRSPPISGTSTTRPRTALEARTPPMEEVSIESGCEGAIGTSAALVGSNGWYKVGSELRKSFYVYTATVPITVEPSEIASVVEMGAEDRYEKYQGNKGFAALEMQQDQGQIPLQYQAVWYQDDLSLTPGTPFRLNGRVFTNSNMFMSENCGGGSGCPIRLYLISSPASCFFQEENSKAVVGGNLVNGGASWDSSISTYAVQVDMFNEDLAVGSAPSSRDITSGSQSVSGEAPRNVAYNNEAYEERIDFLTRSAELGSGGSYTVSGGDVTDTTRDPQVVRTRVKARLREDSSLDPVTVRLEELELYMRNRTRRIPFKEVASGASALGTTYDVDSDSDGLADANAGVFEGSPFASVSAGEAAEGLRPPNAWAFPTDPIDGTTSTGYTGLSLNISGSVALPGMTEPQQQEDQGYEEYLGDRILLGNNLPALWYKDSLGDFVGDDETQELSGINWNAGDGTRYRKTRVQRLDDLGTTNRNGFWERAAADKPIQRLENKGGLRVVTGAGIYVAGDSLFPRKNISFLPAPQLGEDVTVAAPTFGANIVAWPDTMPMWADTDLTAGDIATLGTEDLAFYWEWENDGDEEVPNQLPPVIRDGDSDPPPVLGYSLASPYTAITNDERDLMGDLLMRSTVVYHYANSSPDESRNQLPLACVSSYYDPTTETTAKNFVESGEPDWDERYDAEKGRSNNGVVYDPPHSEEDRTMLMGTWGSRLRTQASIVFPNGRIANPPLRSAMEKYAADSSAEFTFEENGAIDAAICSLRILAGYTSGGFAPDTSPPITPGSIYEQTFLDAQQIRAIHADDGTTDLDETFSFNNGALDAGYDPGYDLPVEERQPLEIRATVLDLNLLRNQGIAAIADAPNPEFMLPNTGIIYATRDDALPDRSAPPGSSQLNLSAVDFKLDPTRRPNAILLINGDRLDRNRTPVNDGNFRDEEKGLVLATPLPVYIKGDFNKHQTPVGAALEEFTTDLADDWGNFYNRTSSAIDPNFACRRPAPPSSVCASASANGDLWRSATIISDSTTLLSDSFEFGYRVDGDYDLRNNAGGGRNDEDSTANGIMRIDRNGDGTIDETMEIFDPEIERRDNGFFANNYVTSHDFLDSDYRSLVTTDEEDLIAYQASSYFNNFVTPVQRRTNFYEYVMEICRKPMVSLCTADDWVVGLTTGTGNEKASEIPIGTPVGNLLSGTTVQMARSPIDPLDTDLNKVEQRYPRRVAFLRNPANNRLIVVTTGTARRPIPIGIKDEGDGTLDWYPYQNPSSGTDRIKLPVTDNVLDLSGSGILTEFEGFGPVSPGANHPRREDNALWYVTRQGSNRRYGNTRWLWYQQQYDGDYLLEDVILDNTSSATWRTAISNEVEQPLLEPVLQQQVTTRHLTGDSDLGSFVNAINGRDPGSNCNGESCVVKWTRWQPRATESTFNIVAVSGQGPVRVQDSPYTRNEDGGGLHNFVRTLENWVRAGDEDYVDLNISGSFIETKKNNYATAPFFTLLNTTEADDAYLFVERQGYKTDNGTKPLGYTGNNVLGAIPYYNPPGRQWGFDLGLLSQPPDLFAEQFTVETAESPKEFMREVNRDDDWVEALMCAAEARDPDSTPQTYVGLPGATYQRYAIPGADQRPNDCLDLSNYPDNPS